MASATAHSPPARPFIGASVAIVALVGAVGAAVLTGQGIGAINTQVETAASGAATVLDNAAGWLPFGYAFGAGLVAAANPCGFVLLPAYLARAVGSASGRLAVRHRLLRALVVSSTVTAGCVLLFGLAGLAIGVGQAAVTPLLPLVGLGVGLLLVVLAGWQIAGGTPYASFGTRLSEWFSADTRRADARGYFAYGLAYGLASLSCTLPIFLTVVASALVGDGLLRTVPQLVLYGLGMASVITGLTLATALAAAATLGRVRGLVRYVERVSVALLLLAGTYIVYYWLTLGGLLAAVRRLF